MTADHYLLKIRSADIPYDDQEAKLRAYYKKLNERQQAGPNLEEQISLRCEQVPALILVGFRKHPSGNTGFPTAVKSLVALRHVDPPQPWGAGPENESLADEVLDELYRQGLISSTKRVYFAGSCTRAEAKAAHLSDDPAIRAAQIASLFLSKDESIERAIRIAVTSQSTRKRITPRLMNELATALILRANADDPLRTDQNRRYLKYAYGKAAHRERWEGTDRSIEQLLAEAMNEVIKALGNPSDGEPGPASLELAVRAAYPLIVSGRLNADRGSTGDQPDRRTPGELLDTIRQTPQGVKQLAQALSDFAAGRGARAVDEEGNIKQVADGSGEQMVTDTYLRYEFPPAGKARAPRPGDTPTDHFNNRVSEFAQAVEHLDSAFRAVAQVIGNDGRPLVESTGVDKKLCGMWREQFGRIDEELVMWGRTFQRYYATSAQASTSSVNLGEEESADEPEDVYADAENWEEATKAH